MGTLVTIQRQTETIQGFQILVPQDMMDALNYLVGTLGYTGGINCNLIGGAHTWQLNFTGGGVVQQVGGINDYIILENNAIATICPAANFSALYHT